MSTDPVANGPSGQGKFIDRIDPDDPEYIRQMRRPAEVKEDLNQMEERKRVNAIMNSKAFREELEQLVAEQMKIGPHPTSLMALQQISELILPQHRITQTSLFNRVGGGASIPICDIRGAESMNYTKADKVHRCKTACLYRVADLLGWSGHGNSFITNRLSQDNEHFLALPNGLLFHEVTAGNLVKVDMGGTVLDSGNTGLQVNPTAFALHAAVHAARPDIKCLIQLRNTAAVAMSCQKQGLLPLSVEALSLGEITTFSYSGLIEDQDRDRLARALGPVNKVILLRNFSVLVGGQTVEEAFLLTRNLLTAFELQTQLMATGGLENIALPTEEERARMVEASRQANQSGEGRRKWRRGEMEFEALMRHLDNAGYRTGHVYHEPMLKKERRTERVNSEVEYPPASTSYQSGEMDPTSPLMRMYDVHKKQHKTEWLNTPNKYSREEMAETGTPNPKKYTKWFPEGGSQSGTPVKLESQNQFAPIGENPKEYKQKFKEIKKEYYEEHIDAGPQSRILEGISWDEAQKMKEQGGDSVIVVGAASKGIIQREHQHNAVVYKQTYASNPFSSKNEDELEEYQAQVAGKPVAGVELTGDELTPGPDGKLISTEERIQAIQASTAVAKDDSAIPASPGTKPPIAPKPTSPTVAPPSPRLATATVNDGRVAAPAEGLLVVPTASRDLSVAYSQDLQRSKSERYPKKKGVNGDQQPMASPSKSQSSAEGTLDERSSREVSPTKEAYRDPGSPEKSSDEKKKKKFRMPSFSKTKDKKVKKSAKQSMV